MKPKKIRPHYVEKRGPHGAKKIRPHYVEKRGAMKPKKNKAKVRYPDPINEAWRPPRRQP